MSSILLNILIGLVTSVLSGGSVVAWRHARSSRTLHRKVAFFGLEPDSECLLIMNNHWQKPGSTSHNDVLTMIEIAALAHEMRCSISILPADNMQGSNGNRTEFCFGTPTSNPRTAGHISSHLPGIRYLPYGTGRDSGALVVGRKKFLLVKGRQEHALVAKFTPRYASRPVILISGDRSIANIAAILYLKREYVNVSKKIESLEKYCFVLRVNASDTYGYDATEFVADVTRTAFGAKAK